jgi:hypothetical protein
LSFEADSSCYYEPTLPTKNCPGATAFPFWDSMYIKTGTSQGIYYTIYGKTPNRTVIFEYYTTLYNSRDRYCHFQVLFFETEPGIVQFKYLYVSDGANSATIGVQGKSIYEGFVFRYD